MPESKFLATPAETLQLIRTFFGTRECFVLPEEAVSAEIRTLRRTTQQEAVPLLSIRETSGGGRMTRRWLPPILLWPAELNEPTVRWKETEGGVIPDWRRSTPSVRCQLPDEVIERHVHKVGWGAIQWLQEYDGATPSEEMQTLYGQLVDRLRRSMSSYLLKHRIRVGKEAKRMVLEGEARFLWRDRWIPE